MNKGDLQPPLASKTMFPGHLFGGGRSGIGFVIPLPGQKQLLGSTKPFLTTTEAQTMACTSPAHSSGSFGISQFEGKGERKAENDFFPFFLMKKKKKKPPYNLKAKALTSARGHDKRLGEKHKITILMAER